MQTLPPPGELITVNGQALHLQRSGAGSPTVILESGFGNDSLIWALVQPAIAQFTQVVSYDRAGLGWSAPNAAPRTSDQIAQELAGLLHAAHLPPPYILVGHSMGGIYVRKFAQLYPETVVGMVLVDSAYEQQVTRTRDDIRALDEATDAAMLRQLQELSQLSVAELQAQTQSTEPSPFPPEIRALMQDRKRPTIYATLAREYEAFMEELTAPEPPTLGNLPLIVLSQTENPPEPHLTDEQNAYIKQFWGDLQREQAALSTNSQQHWIDCGHYIQLERPQVVIDAVQHLVMTTR